MTLARFRVALLWAAILFAVVMALLPHPPATPIDRYGDKFQHMVAFGTITILACWAYPRASLLTVAERLSFMGALIEVFQSIPALGRDCDPLDWLTDTAVIVAVVLIVRAARRRNG